MTITSQSLNAAEKTKFEKLRQEKSGKNLDAMNKTLSKIVQAAINGAGQAESANIKNRIALAMRRTFRLD